MKNIYISSYKQLLITTLILTISFLFFSFKSENDNFQEYSGKIIDQQNQQPIPGASILIKGTLNATVTDANGKFYLKSKSANSTILIISFIGYEQQEIELTGSKKDIIINLNPQTIHGKEVVVTASRVEETIFQSPVAIEKLNQLAIKDAPQGSYFDAIEALKGIQFTTLSMGFRVPNTRGFANTTNARFLQLVDGVDNQAPGLGVSIGNTVGPTELDILNVEVSPGASSALYGMNALNGMSNLITKNPFYHQGLSVYQKTGVNHVDGVDFSPKPISETAIRYAKAFNNKFAFKINAGYFTATDWVASSAVDLNPDANASTGLIGENNPAKDPLNSYGNENSNRKSLTLADGKIYEVRRTGYYEKDLVNNNYKVENLKADLALHYKLNDKLQAIYTYRIGTSDNIYQRGNRIRLDDYQIQQHALELKSPDFFVRTYLTLENTTKSYNLRPLGENLDRNFKSDTKWFNEYTSAFNSGYANGLSIIQAHQAARASADFGRYEPGTELFNQKVKELNAINNWDLGSQLVLKHQLYHVEGQYNLSKYTKKYVDILIGGDFRNFFVNPDGNSFSNPDTTKKLEQFTYYKTGGFVQLSKKLLNETIKVIASVRVDKTQYFQPKINPRAAIVYTPSENHSFRFSLQNGYRFPTLFEAFSTVPNGGVKRFGGIDILTRQFQLFENSYVRSSVDAFQKAITKDINVNGKTKNQAIIDNRNLLTISDYTYLKPEQINSFDLGYKANLFNDKLFLDVDFYYNVYKNFIDQIEISVPKVGKIGSNVEGGIDSTIFQMESSTNQTRYRMWTNAKSTYQNYGFSVGVNYNFIKKWNLSVNYSFAKLSQSDGKDKYLETPFNTPQDILNVGIGNREITKNFGFNVSFRYQSAFEWKAPLGNGVVPEYYTADLQVTYRIPSIKGAFKLGGTNIFNKRYIQYTGGPTIGATYYLAATFDGLFNK
jgi:iron complex outermembrane receptor protein